MFLTVVTAVALTLLLTWSENSLLLLPHEIPVYFRGPLAVTDPDDAVFGGIILAQCDELVPVMQGHYSSYPNVTAYNQVKSKVAFIISWASHRCDSYQCFVITQLT